jgi:CRISPR-associated protein Csd1
MKKGGHEMSWIQKLYETYNNCQSMVGYSGEEGARPLLPICHISAQAHIEIVIDKEGNFQRARVITDQKNDATTIVPCTEGSASRAGRKPECHTLCDKLQYVAGDFTKYGGTVTSGFADDPGEPHRNYIEALSKWCESKFSLLNAEAVLKYATKNTVIRDLVEHQILYIGSEGKFLTKGEVKREKNAPDIFSVINSQEDAFVRWIVESPGVLDTEVWKDKTLWESWIGFYFSTKKKERLCFVTGEEGVLSDNHPKYIRAKGDGAKLISSNDTSGFTFRGRFLTSQQACNVSLEVSQKAHNALLWLIDKQGKVFWVKGDGGRKEPGLAIVAWVTLDKRIPQPTDDATDILGFNDLPSDEVVTHNTAQNIALKLRKKILGYSADLGSTKSIQIMSMDSASKGRLAITYYQERGASDYLERINKWHEECAWIHRYRFQEIQGDISGKKKRHYYTFVGAPAPIDIAEATYGEKADDKLKKAVIARILPCIIDGQQIPQDLVEAAVRRACNRIAMDYWEWNKTLSIACALYRKINLKENYAMTLDLSRKTRDYLYGRLLALAENLEEWALNKAHEDRETNAARLMQRFAERPYSTWRTIELALTPSKARLGGKSKKRQRMIDEVIASFDGNDFLNDKRLSGEFLLGYHCQREYLRALTNTNKEPDDEND